MSFDLGIGIRLNPFDGFLRRHYGTQMPLLHADFVSDMYVVRGKRIPMSSLISNARATSAWGLDLSLIHI